MSTIKIILFTFVSVFFLSFAHLNAGLFESIDAVKVLHISSIKQIVQKKNKVIFEDDVEVFIDQTLHIWADRVEVDKEKKLLIAEKVAHGPVVLENKDFVILTDRFVLNLEKKTGFADQIKIHLLEGYISAAKAEKLGENKWRMQDIQYTACDANYPHWALSARKAVVHGGYFIRISGMLFKVGKIPIFGFPKMAFPIQGKSRSGFLIPKFYVDYDYGFGFKQEYYHHIKSRCDTTIGLDWRDKKGFVFFDEFRWVRTPESFSFFNGHYAIARNEFILEGDSIVRSKKKHYWISGKNFQNHGTFFGTRLNSLVCADFGTDKRFGYQFFNKTEDVDDSFFNAGIMRGLWVGGSAELRLDSMSTSRRRFSDLSSDEQKNIKNATKVFMKNDEKDSSFLFQKKELENRVTITHLPRVEWNSTYTFLGSNLLYRHLLFSDQMFYQEQETENLFFESMLIQQKQLIPFKKANVIRADYHGSLQACRLIKSHAFHATINPHMQLRSSLARDEDSARKVLEKRLFAHGAGRLFLDCGLEWALPEYSVLYDDYFHALQPIIRGEYCPFFSQDHWYFMDKWDRFYPQKKIEFLVRNNWIFDDVSVDCNLAQAYDFYNQSLIFPLRRANGLNKHLLPLRMEVDVDSPSCDFLFRQEYGFCDKKLLNSQALIGLKQGKNRIEFGYLFQHASMLQAREFLSNISHFLLLGLTFQVSKYGLLHYGGQYYSEKGRHFFELSDIKPLLHTICFEYNGHCWGFHIGFEEKKYREYGNNKHDRTIVFSLRFDSLGSFAKKFKRPQIIREQAVN